MVGLQGSYDFDMGHKGPVLRPRCIGAVRYRTHMQSINQSINLKKDYTLWVELITLNSYEHVAYIVQNLSVSG